jgi:hypothetical protein
MLTPRPAGTAPLAHIAQGTGNFFALLLMFKVRKDAVKLSGEEKTGNSSNE